MTRRGAALYRCLLLLYPDAFRRRFADELASDFEDGASDAWAVGPLAFARWCAGVACDFLISLGREWLRTLWVPAGTIAATLSVAVFSYAAYKSRQPLHYSSWQPALGADLGADDRQLIVLLTIAVLIPIVGIILGSVWMLSFLRRRSADRARRRA